MNLNFQFGPLKFSLGKTISPDLAGWLRGQEMNDESGARLVTPYAQSAWVYIAVSRLAEKVSQIPFRISRISGGQARKVRALRNASHASRRSHARRALGEDILVAGPAVDLFDRPHPTMNRQLFWEMCVTWLALRGETFILPMDSAGGAVNLTDRSPRVAQLITLPPDMFWHVVSGYELTAWRYTGSPLISPIPSEMLLPGEVIQCRSPNPYLYWRGMSPVVVAMIAAGADYAASQYSRGYWLNNADTGVIVTTDQQASPEQQAAILAALRERKRKAGTADRPLFLWGGAKVEKPQLSGMETQFIENRKMNRQEIGAIFKVPDSVMGFTDAKSTSLSGGGAAMDSEQASFIENSIAPICTRIEAGLQPVVEAFGPDLIGWFDLESLPIMQDARRDRLDSATKAFALGAAFNDINQNYDLGFPDYPWGGKSFLPFNLQEVSQLLAAPDGMPTEDDPESNEDPGEDSDKTNPVADAEKFFRRLQLRNTQPATRSPRLHVLWQSHVTTRAKSVNLFRTKTGRVINDYRVRTLRKLAEIHLEKHAAASETRTPEHATKGVLDLIFNANSFGTDLLAALTTPIRSTLQTAGDELHDEIGLDGPWKMPQQFVKDFIAGRTQPIMGVGGTARDQLNTSLQAGLDAGETHDELAARVSQVYSNLAKFESKRVAMTEVNMAYNAARHNSMGDAGIEYKTWLSSHGPNVREAHAAAEEDYIDDPIPIGEPFEVGGEWLMYPGDDSQGASLDNIINCQCVQLAAQKKSEDAKNVTFLILGHGLLTFAKP